MLTSVKAEPILGPQQSGSFGKQQGRLLEGRAGRAAARRKQCVSLPAGTRTTRTRAAQEAAHNKSIINFCRGETRMRLTPRLTLLAATLVVVGGCATEPQKPAPAPAAAPAAAAPAKPISAAATVNMANNCFACHGPNGVSPGAIPSLDTLTADNIKLMFRLFTTGERPSTVMGRHAKAYSDAEVEAIAKYIAGLNKK
jgi:sulfide dehydrogenase cytochrome subunit